MQSGLRGKSRSKIDATIITIPKQRNTRSENIYIKSGTASDGWEERPERLWQKELDARWTKKYGDRYYSYNNVIKFDVEHLIIRCDEVVSANIHDSQLIPSLLDPENEGDVVCVDLDFAG